MYTIYMQESIIHVDVVYMLAMAVHVAVVRYKSLRASCHVSVTMVIFGTAADYN